MGVYIILFVAGSFSLFFGWIMTLKNKNKILENRVNILAEKLEVEFFDRKEMDKLIKEYMAKDEMISAVKLYREKTGADLIEAKQYVESL